MARKLKKLKGPILTTPLIDIGNPKMAREHLCRLQSVHHFDTQGNTLFPTPWNENDPIDVWIREMIRQIDILRPLGRDGRHGNLHTEFCGCLDKGPAVCKWCQKRVLFDNLFQQWMHSEDTASPQCAGIWRRGRVATPVWF